MSNEQDMMRRLLGKAMATAWLDPNFKSRLITNPRSVLVGFGLTPPPHLELDVMENTAQKFYVTLPAPWVDQSNPTFMQRLQQNPAAVLTEAGINFPDNAEIVFLENTNRKMYIILSVAPSPDEISIQKM